MKAKAQTPRQEWLPYVRQLADMMSLRDWRIEIGEDRPWDKDCIATVACTEGARWAVIRLEECFFTHTPSEQRHSVVHELVHCHFAPYCKAVEKRTDNDAVLRLLMEYSVDSLADAIAPHVPLPPRR